MQTLDPGNDTTPTRSRYVDLPTVADTGEHHAWNIFGKSDEVGTLNLIDAASRDAIMRQADASRVYDLSVDNFVGMPGWTEAGAHRLRVLIEHSVNLERAATIRRLWNTDSPF